MDLEDSVTGCVAEFLWMLGHFGMPDADAISALKIIKKHYFMYPDHLLDQILTVKTLRSFSLALARLGLEIDGERTMFTLLETKEASDAWRHDYLVEQGWQLKEPAWKVRKQKQ